MEVPAPLCAADTRPRPSTGSLYRSKINKLENFGKEAVTNVEPTRVALCNAMNLKRYSSLIHDYYTGVGVVVLCWLAQSVLINH